MQKQDQIKLLEDTLELFGDGGEHWIQGSYANNIGGYCLAGGLARSAELNGFADDLVTNLGFGSLADEIVKKVGLHDLVQLSGYAHVPDFNDLHAFHDVVALIKKRIRQLHRQMAEEVKSMEIGTKKETITIEPVTEPVPNPEPSPKETPVETPAEAPAEEPVEVPA